MTSLYTSIFDFVKFYSPISSALFEISYPFLFFYKYIYWMLTAAQSLVEIVPRSMRSSSTGQGHDHFAKSSFLERFIYYLAKLHFAKYVGRSCLCVCWFVCLSVTTLLVASLCQSFQNFTSTFLRVQVRNRRFLVEIDPRSRSRSPKTSKTPFWP